MGSICEMMDTWIL